MIYFCKLNYTTGIISNYYLIWKFSNIWIAIKLKISTKKLICFHFQSCFLIIRSQWINKRNVDIVCSRLKLTANFDFKTTIWSHLNLNDKKKGILSKICKASINLPGYLFVSLGVHHSSILNCTLSLIFSPFNLLQNCSTNWNQIWLGWSLGKRDSYCANEVDLLFGGAILGGY